MPEVVRPLLNSKDKAVSQLIPEEVVQEVLLRADIVDVIGDYVQLKRTGANAKGLCPFHQEKTPSFTVSPAKGLFYCFGCHASGNVFRFLMQYEHMTFPEAVRFLAARYGMRLPEAQSAAAAQQESLSPLYALHQAAATFFHECLLRDPAAQPARAGLSPASDYAGDGSAFWARVCASSMGYPVSGDAQTRVFSGTDGPEWPCCGARVPTWGL